MSKTVSFRASEELDEFLEQEAERRMTTKSTVAQMLIAERVRQIKDGEDESEVEDQSAEEEGSSRPGSDGSELDTEELPPIFEERSDSWWVPDSEDHILAVRREDGGRRYYKTVDGAAERLRGQDE